MIPKKQHLSPCPFCGNEKISLGKRGELYTVKCQVCDIEWGLWYTATRSEDAWNRPRISLKKSDLKKLFAQLLEEV